VDVDLATDRVTVSTDKPVEDSAIRAAVSEAGYQVVG
jgi:copper chaperone